MKTKICTGPCGKRKKVTEFSKRASRPSGHISYCKECDASRRRTYYAANKEVIAEKYRIYCAANKEALAERKRAYCLANKEIISKRNRAYRRTPQGLTTALLSRINRRTINGAYPRWANPHDRHYLTKRMADGRVGVHLDITRDELLAFVTKNWQTIKQIWAKGETVSIDRIKSDDHYRLGNIRFISLKKNSQRPNKARSKRKTKSTA